MWKLNLDVKKLRLDDSPTLLKFPLNGEASLSMMSTGISYAALSGEKTVQGGSPTSYKRGWQATRVQFFIDL